ncbi:hypothetical protein V502_01366 [Pseudogymnoascus sp. VKM F-4520 (FW-2644)]|nr:hypothetical protein V502_01366 [Pseudogymnoascus sp. VKM F-4520 (FW-2644)]
MFEVGRFSNANDDSVQRCRQDAQLAKLGESNATKPGQVVSGVRRPDESAMVIASILRYPVKHPRTLQTSSNESLKEIVISEEFESLEEARNALDQAADGLFRAFYMWDVNLPVALQPTESLAIFDKYTFQLSLWNLAFENFMASKGKNLTSREVQGAALLKIHHTTAKMMAGVRPDMSDMRAVFEAVNADKFLEYLDDFRIVINLSRPLIAAAEQDAKNGKPPLTFRSDLGLIGPLYYVCINCPTVSIRTTAMELLLRCPRQEGMWNSVLVAQMIQQYWELEARHKEEQEMGVKVDEFGFPVPFNDRGSVHFEYFGRPIETNTADVSHFPPPEVATPELERSPPSLGLRSIPATHGDTPHGLDNIPEGPFPEVQAIEDMNELVASYRDLVGTADDFVGFADY